MRFWQTEVQILSPVNLINFFNEAQLDCAKSFDDARTNKTIPNVITQIAVSLCTLPLVQLFQYYFPSMIILINRWIRFRLQYTWRLLYNTLKFVSWSCKNFVAKLRTYFTWIWDNILKQYLEQFLLNLEQLFSSTYNFFSKFYLHININIIILMTLHTPGPTFQYITLIL